MGSNLWYMCTGDGGARDEQQKRKRLNYLLRELTINTPPDLSSGANQSRASVKFSFEEAFFRPNWPFYFVWAPASLRPRPFPGVTDLCSSNVSEDVKSLIRQ